MKYLLIASTLVVVMTSCKSENNPNITSEDKNQTKRSIVRAFSNNPIFQRVFNRDPALTSLPDAFLQQPNKQNHYQIVYQTNYGRPNSQNNDFAFQTPTFSHTVIRPSTTTFDKPEQSGFTDHDVLIQNGQKGTLGSTDVTTESIINSSTILNEINKNNDTDQIDTRISSSTSNTSSEINALNIPEMLFTSAPVLEYSSSTNTASQETIETPETTEQSTLANIGSNNTVEFNVSPQSTNLTQNTLSPSESHTLQLDKDDREKIFVILNKRLLNSLSNLRNGTNETNQENIFSLFPQISSSNSLSPSNVLTRDTTHSSQNTTQTISSKKHKSKKVNKSPMGNIIAQFFMQAMGVNNKSNLYNKSGIAVSEHSEESGLKDLLEIWKQNTNQSFEGRAPSQRKAVKNRVQFSKREESFKSFDSTLAKLTGLKLEESLNKRIQRDSNLFSL